MKEVSVVNLDPISRTRRKQDSPIGRLFKTRHFKGKHLSKSEDFGHYLFVGKQGSSKTTSAIWYMEFLTKKWLKRGKDVNVYSNMGIGYSITRANLHETIFNLRYDRQVINIIIIDEIQSYFPKDTKDKTTLQMIDQLTGDFSQLRKRQCYVLSTAQVYGRLNKNLREQCLYMVNCRRSMFSNKAVNDFISGDDVMCDDLGRWSGVPKFIYVHGLPKTKFDTHALILQ